MLNRKQTVKLYGIILIKNQRYGYLNIVFCEILNISIVFNSLK